MIPLKPVKALKLSDYFQIKKPSYTYLKLIPDSSIRNYNSAAISKSIALMYKSLYQRIRRENKKLIIEADINVSYMIYIKKNDVSFIMAIPNYYRDIITDKIRSTWKKITIEEIKEPPKVDGCLYNIFTGKEDALSLNTDHKNNNPLNQVFNIFEILKDGDEILINAEFTPINQIYWRGKYEKAIGKIRDGKNVNKYLTPSKILIEAITFILDIIRGAGAALTGAELDGNDSLNILESAIGIVKNNALSAATTAKKNDLVVNTLITVKSASTDAIREHNNALVICQSYKSIDQDNVLFYREIKGRQKLRKNIFSINECGNFIQLAGRELQERYGFINHIDTNESAVPEELKKGNICLGVNTYKGQKTAAYMSNDREYKYLTYCIVGPTRAGKSTLLENISRDSINAGECVINFDFCGTCKLSEDLSGVIPKDKVLNIECSNHTKLEGLAFNEINYSGGDPFLKYRAAKEKAALLVEFIDNININNPLEPRMLRYLKAAAIIAYYQNKPTAAVLEALEDHETRGILIKNVEGVEELKKSIKVLNELDDYNKAGEITGTKTSYIQGILNRADIIRSNTFMELMLDKQGDDNINFIHEMQQNQLINIKIPETMFKTDMERDIYCLYYLIKIWGALQERAEQIQDKDIIKANLLIDELYQVPLTQTFLKGKLNQIAKKRCKPIISCHSLEQIKYIRPELKAANTSYMMISGCNKDNYNELKEELSAAGYELEDLLRLKRYHSLNLIKTGTAYSTFITKLPEPI